MEILSQYEIPYLHPLAVHFPLVLLLLGAGAAVFYLVLGRAVWRQAGLVLFALGALGAWAASVTGEDLYPAVEGDPLVERVIETHHDAADATTLASAVAAGLFLIVSVARFRPRRRKTDEGDDAPAPPSKREPLWGRLLVLLPALAAAALVAWTAHLGGIMVWGVPR